MNDFVSRGGIKLQAAIENWKFDIKNLVVLDVGSSTGGFVDCLLQNGASKVYSVDTCYGELAWKLRNNSKVVVMERTNILHLQHLSEDVIARSKATRQSVLEDRHAGARDDDRRVDLITIDAGWTKLELILPVVKKFLRPDGIIIALLKPHYEADKKDLVKGVVPVEFVEKIQHLVLDKIKSLGFEVKAVMDSPILGGGGNKEFLLLLKKRISTKT